MLQPSIIQQFFGQVLSGSKLMRLVYRVALGLVGMISLGLSSASGRGLNERGCYACHLGGEVSWSSGARPLPLSDIRARFVPGYLAHLISQAGGDAHLSVPHRLPMSETEALSLVSALYQSTTPNDLRVSKRLTHPDVILSRAKKHGCTQCHGKNAGGLFEQLGRFQAAYLLPTLTSLEKGQSACGYSGQKLPSDAVQAFGGNGHRYEVPTGAPRTSEAFYSNIVARQCGGCHEGAKMPKRYLDLRKVWGYLRSDWLARFLEHPTAVRQSGLSPGDGLRHPQFNLSPAESRELVAQMKSLGKSEPSLATKSLGAYRLQAVERLVRGRYGCLGCHSMGGQGGHSAPVLDGVGRRLRPSAIRDVLLNAQHYNPESVMPTWQWKESRSKLQDLVSFLVQLKSPGDQSSYIPWSQLDSGETASRTETQGARLYGIHCVQCHGTTGKGDGFNARFLNVPPMVHAKSEALAKSTDERLLMGLSHGGWVLGKSSLMPGFGGLLSIQQLKSVVGHLRTLCQCSPPAWSEDNQP